MLGVEQDAAGILGPGVRPVGVAHRLREEPEALLLDDGEDVDALA